jgi:hypothetical protein
MGMAFMSSCTFKDMSHMTFAPIHTPYRTNKVHSDWSMGEGMKIYFPLRFDPHIVNFTAIVSQIYMDKIQMCWRSFSPFSFGIMVQETCLNPCNPSHHNPKFALPSVPSSVSCRGATKLMQPRVGCAKNLYVDGHRARG